jgi:hypothetical protein
MLEEIVAIVPAWNSYRVVRIGNEIFIIELDAFRVVDVIEDWRLNRLEISSN